MEIKRDTFWNISFNMQVFFYILAAVAIIVFLYGFYRRYALWKKGEKEKVDWKAVKDNIQYFMGEVFNQKKIKRDKKIGVIHRLISYGFIILFIGTTLVFIDNDFRIPILQGTFYLIYELVLDIFGVLFIIGLFMMLRVRNKKTRTRLINRPIDKTFIWLLILISIGGFVIEGIRIAETGVAYGVWSPVGFLLSLGFKDTFLFNQGNYIVWWMTHAILAFTIIAMIPYTKLFHMLIAPLNILIQPTKRTGSISMPYTLVELQNQDLIESKKVTGVTKISDFTSLQLMSTDACTECGRCTNQCPAYASEKILSPRSVIMKIRDNMSNDHDLFNIISKEEISSCTTCGACVEACPVSINHVDMILAMRRGLVNQLKVNDQSEKALINMDEQGNIWGKPWSERSDWSKGMNIPVAEDKDRDKRGAL